jgi:hypothetical protein
MAVMLSAPFVLLAVAENKADGLLWLLFPIMLLIAALLVSLLLFAPFEAVVEKLGMNANIWLPLFGGILGAIVVAVALKTSRNPQVIEKLLAGDPTTVGATVGIVAVGAAVAGAWRLSLWALRAVNWA